MTVMLNLIEKAIDILDQEREWLSSMAFGLFAENFYKLFCIRVYANGGNEWGVSASLRVSDRRIYIGLHEKEAQADTLPKAVYLHVDALRGLTNSLNQAIIEVDRHIEGSDRPFTPFGGDAISPAAFEQSVRAALVHDS